MSPPLTIAPGKLLYSKNYECDMMGRYKSIQGYERFDGQPKPSDASYWALNFDAGTAAVSEGNTVTGATSGATGKALIDGVVTSGAYATSDAAGYLVLTVVTGTFQDDENIQVSAVTKCVADGAATSRGASNDTDDDTWLQDAIEAARTLIQAVPGTGNILGVWQYNGVKYALRNNAGDTATDMYKSSTSGWTLCALGYRLNFTTGMAAFVENETVSQGGVTAVVKRVVAQSGTWGAGTAAGYLVIYTLAGGNFAAGAITGSIAGAATASGAQTTNTLTKSGRYEFENINFGGHAGTIKMYGVNGVNQAFEWDGSTFTPIVTGMTIDKPNHLRGHKNHLFLIFKGGSIQHSSIGMPYIWTPITGAAELMIGEEITGAEVLPGDVLGIWGRNKTALLYGTSAADWELKIHAREVGAIEWTIQNMALPVYLDDRGLTSLTATDVYGDFSAKSLSNIIKPLIDDKKTLVISSLRVRGKDQYRLFFSDDTGISLTIHGDKVVGFTRLDYGNPALCACSVENTRGDEELFFGSDTGYVYQLDSGQSFDGSAIETFARLPFNHLKSPLHKKRFRSMTLEVEGRTTIYYAPDFSYGDPQYPAAASFNLNSGGGYWDQAVWGVFYWSESTVGTAQALLDGIGLNMGLLMRTSEAYEDPHTLQGLLLCYDVRGIQR
ncbi:MAG: hypothetical protein QME44_01725 [Thermodesulfobacteriota bacterium]|nr:hypothetical protein [Thermodesulfobacteriota bacterium]